MTTGTFDQITQDDLRAAGSLKWTNFPDMIGAFVAEMDFGLAPAINSAVKDALDLGVTGYLPEKLAKDLSQATARWYSDSYGWEISPERVHHVPDVIAAFELAIEHFTTPGSVSYTHLTLPTKA